jgi:hypothetical protein
MMADIMSFFRAKPVAPAPVAAAGPNSQVANPTVPSSATPTPAQGANPNTAFGGGDKTAEAPLGNFNKLWETDPNKKAPVSAVPAFNQDPAKMMELAGTFDFTKHIDPALVARVQKGEGAAIVELVNQSAQAGFAHSNLATTEIVKTALTQLNEKYEKDIIPGILKAERTRNTVAEDNAIFSNPAAQPVVNMIQSQMMEKYPTASAQEIKTLVSDYISGFAEAAIGQSGRTIQNAPDPKTKKLTRGEHDWEKLLG